MKKIILLIHKALTIILISSIYVANSYAGNLFSSVDRNIISSNQTFTLIVQYDELVDASNLKLDQLKNNFDILSVIPERLNASTIVNGSVNRKTSTTWRITLAPKRLGELTIPSFSVNGDLSQEIVIEVNDGTSTNTDQTLKIVISADSDSVYESEQLMITVEIYAQQGLSNLALSPIETDAEIKELSQDKEQRIENGIIRDIFTNRYIIFPSKPGKITIPSTTITAIKGGQNSIFGSSRVERVVARSVPFEITVKAKDLTHSPWFPAKEVIMDAEWSGDKNAITAGEPITRTITISALGKESSAIPPLKLTTSEDYKSYKDQAITNDKRTYKGFISQRTESEAIVFSSPGTFTLPAVTMKWWNTKTNAWQDATIAQETVTVLPGSGVTKEPNKIITPPLSATPEKTDSTTVITSNKTHWVWPLISTLLFIICLIQAYFLWVLRSANNSQNSFSSQQKNNSEKNAWLHFQQAIKTNDLIEIRQALHDWAQTLSPNTKQTSIHELVNYLHDSQAKIELSGTITELDRCLYKESNAFNSAALFEQLLQLRKHIQSKGSSADHHKTLAPLYNS